MFSLKKIDVSKDAKTEETNSTFKYQSRWKHENRDDYFSVFFY